MASFVSKKIISIGFGTTVTVSMIAAFCIFMYNGAISIASNFTYGAFTVGLAPLFIYLVAFYYQSKVVFPMRQIFVESKNKMTEFQKSFVRMIEDGYFLARWVPMLITIFSSIIAVTIVPATLFAYIDGDAIWKSVVSALIISANIMLYIKMVRQIFDFLMRIKFI